MCALMFWSTACGWEVGEQSSAVQALLGKPFFVDDWWRQSFLLATYNICL